MDYRRLHNVLRDALVEKHRANAVIEITEKQIELIIKKMVYNKYKDIVLYNDGLEFELFGVNCFICADISEETVEVNLAYACKSKLPKAKRDRVEQVKEVYLKKRYIEYCNYNIALWKELRFDLSLIEALSGNFNLSIT